MVPETWKEKWDERLLYRIYSSFANPTTISVRILSVRLYPSFGKLNDE
jgi:hypothetical protein